MSVLSKSLKNPCFSQNKSSEQAGSSEERGCFPAPGRKEPLLSREYKSDVFSMLMENKTYALEVYNALRLDPNMKNCACLKRSGAGR